MAIGIIGRALGMTRVFDEFGTSIPVTVVEVQPNRVTQIRKVAKDGYCAVQVTTGERRPVRVSKPLAGHFAKANTEAGRGLWEFRTQADSDLQPGDTIGLEQFEAGHIVDVTGTSKGKGYAGVIKRWNFKMQDATHGNSLSHRAPGSIGQCQTPGRVFKGKKMAGQMGNVRVTIQNLEIIKVDTERRVLWISGSVPGPEGGDVMVRPAVKLVARGAAARSQPKTLAVAP